VALYQGFWDEFTPILAYIAGVVRFLDSVTEGEDVRLDGLLTSCERGWSLPAWELEEKVEHVTARGWRSELEIAAPTTIRLSFRGEDASIEDRLRGAPFQLELELLPSRGWL
jgi:hypothetical protein